MAELRCLRGCSSYPLSDAVYVCQVCGDLLEVFHPQRTAGRDAAAWRALFAGRAPLQPGPDGSGVWRYREWVLPDLPVEHIVTLGEGNSPLTETRLGHTLDVRLFVKQCGHTLSGSFKDLGMTVLVSHVHHLRQTGARISAVACASTGDTSAALAAYGAAAEIPTLVFLPRGKIARAQLLQPLANGARVVAIDTDFDGCMAHIDRLTREEGVYLANSKNSLRIEGQKTVAFEIVQGLGWRVPDWVAIPGGNLGNVSALVRGFALLREAGIVDRLPRVLCAQAGEANPLYRSYRRGFDRLEPVQARVTHASAIRIGNPVSYAKAVAALQTCNGVVESISEDEIVDAAREADAAGLFVCPQSAVALAAVTKQRLAQTIEAGATVVVVATAHGLKFAEFKEVCVPHSTLVEVPNDYGAVRAAALAHLG